MKEMRKCILALLVLLGVVALISACQSANSSASSDKKEIISFSVEVGGNQYPASFDGYNGTITVLYGTDVTALVPTIVISDGASIWPESGVSQDFTNPVKYTVTAGDNSMLEYTLRAIVKSANRLEKVVNKDGTCEWNNPWSWSTKYYGRDCCRTFGCL